MIKLWTNGRFEVDSFQVIDDAASLPHDYSPLVSLARWRQQRAELATLRAVGVIVDPSAELSRDGDALHALAMIAIPFAKFTDGRGYSLARRLRDQYGFRSELRATGEVLLDQIPLMLRCGFDSFAITHAPTLRELEAGHIPAIPEIYQTAVFGRARTRARFATGPLLDAAE